MGVSYSTPEEVISACKNTYGDEYNSFRSAENIDSCTNSEKLLVQTLSDENGSMPIYPSYQNQGICCAKSGGAEGISTAMMLVILFIVLLVIVGIVLRKQALSQKAAKKASTSSQG